MAKTTAEPMITAFLVRAASCSAVGFFDRSMCFFRLLRLLILHLKQIKIGMVYNHSYFICT
jgi:hypothetical protein